MIANHAHADGTGSYPSISTLARETRLSERGVRYCIERLRDSGELLVFPNRGLRGSNLYQIPLRQSLPQEKSDYRQDYPALRQNSPLLAAKAIAYKPKNRHIEPSVPTLIRSMEEIREEVARRDREAQERFDTLMKPLRQKER